MLVWRWWICRSSLLRRWDRVGLRQHRMSPGQRAIATSALVLAAGLFIDSQSLVGDGASLDLATVEARRLFQCAYRRRCSLAAPSWFQRVQETMWMVHYFSILQSYICKDFRTTIFY
jgi:hypothetical protein